MRSTHTVALLELSAPAYDEIAGKLRDAAYDHCFVEDFIDMTGIGVSRIALTSSARELAEDSPAVIVGEAIFASLTARKGIIDAECRKATGAAAIAAALPKPHWTEGRRAAWARLVRGSAAPDGVQLDPGEAQLLIDLVAELEWMARP